MMGLFLGEIFHRNLAICHLLDATFQQMQLCHLDSFIAEIDPGYMRPASAMLSVKIPPPQPTSSTAFPARLANPSI